MQIDVNKVADILRHVANVEVLPRFNNLSKGDVREKNPGDFVTVADEASEKMLSAMLREYLPGSDVVGEEAVSKDPKVLEKLATDRPIWVVDPIDGT
ncbi:MAG: inositol monophosphatase family protein, partial [Alphaproteobacteria bacterium]